MAEDLDTQYAQQFAPMIASAIREQCATYCDAVEEDTFPEVLKRQAAENGNEGQQGGDFDDLRIVVKVGSENEESKLGWLGLRFILHHHQHSSIVIFYYWIISFSSGRF